MIGFLLLQIVVSLLMVLQDPSEKIAQHTDTKRREEQKNKLAPMPPEFKKCYEYYDIIDRMDQDKIKTGKYVKVIFGKTVDMGVVLKHTITDRSILSTDKCARTYIGATVNQQLKYLKKKRKQSNNLTALLILILVGASALTVLVILFFLFGG